MKEIEEGEEEREEENMSAQEVFQRGEGFLEEKKVELARECYRNAIKLQHTNPLYWSRLGYTYFMEAKYEEALNPFLHALDMDKTDPVNFLDFGNVQW
jgi:tetratricopeptide (TPR) repeat protein